MTGDAITTRPATVADLDAVFAIVVAGFESYREFLPEGWQPPDAADERANLATRLADPATWKLVACLGGEPVGHMGFVPGRVRSAADSPAPGPDPPLVPGMAHLWQLFVLPRWWGSGVADHLHALGLDEMRSQGFALARLFTPAPHGRARRFYERRGWAVVAEEHNAHLGLDMVEYRLDL